MINSVNAFNSVYPIGSCERKNISKSPTAGFDSFNSGVNNISNYAGSNFGQKSVFVNGKFYPVNKVPESNPLKSMFAQSYKEAVVIDGKQYDVKTVSDKFTCDGTKQVVIIDGKEYPVSGGSCSPFGDWGGNIYFDL